MEFFGCEQGKGVLLPTDEGDGSFLVAGGARVSLYLPPWEQGVFELQAGQRVSFHLPPRGWEFFGCRQGKGVSLPTAEGQGVFGCRQGEGVSLPTTEVQGVFWLQAGQRCLSTYRRRGMGVFWLRERGEGVLLPTAVGGWIFLVANRAKVSFYLPPRDRSRKTPTPREGWAVMGDCGRIIGAKRILYECNVGGLNNLILAQEEQ